MTGFGERYWYDDDDDNEPPTNEPEAHRSRAESLPRQAVAAGA